MPSRAERLARDMARAAAAEVIGDTNKLSSLRITKFGRHRDGFFHTNITVNNETFYAHYRWGSWMIPRDGHDTDGRQTELLSPYRDVMTEKMRAFESNERRYRAKRGEEAMATAVNASDATRLLRLIGYSDDEIVEAVAEKFKVTRDAARGTLQHVDNHLQTQEASHGSH